VPVRIIDTQAIIQAEIASGPSLRQKKGLTTNRNTHIRDFSLGRCKAPWARIGATNLFHALSILYSDGESPTGEASSLAIRRIARYFPGCRVAKSDYNCKNAPSVCQL
jgi:hypothetical protein